MHCCVMYRESSRVKKDAATKNITNFRDTLCSAITENKHKL